MKHIKLYEEFVNESLSAVEKFAKKLASDIEKEGVEITSIDPIDGEGEEKGFTFGLLDDETGKEYSVFVTLDSFKKKTFIYYDVNGKGNPKEIIGRTANDVLKPFLG